MAAYDILPHGITSEGWPETQDSAAVLTNFFRNEGTFLQDETTLPVHEVLAVVGEASPSVKVDLHEVAIKLVVGLELSYVCADWASYMDSRGTITSG